MRLCKDCKHFVLNTEEWEATQFQAKYAVCGLTSKVTGLDGEKCSDRRRTVNWFSPYCGPEGKQWEAK